jgi:acyl-CoA thioester hydrolase
MPGRRNVLPTFEEISQLPIEFEAAVGPEHIDANGHMNIRHYLEFNARGTWRIVEGIGINDGYRSGRALGLFTAEHHLRYYSELRDGELFSVHVRVLGRSERAVHLMAFLLDRARRRLANTLEVVAVHVDLTTRASAPIPADISGRIDRQIERSDELSWPSPTCGVMGVRDSSSRTLANDR